MANRRRWWDFARVLQRTPTEDRKKLLHSKMRWHLSRIATLHPTLGRELDEHLAPLRVHAFVAYAPDLLDLPRSVGQHRRHLAVMKFWNERARWPLADELHILGVNTGTAAPEPASAAPPPTGATPEAAAAAPAQDAGLTPSALLAEGLAAACERQDPELAAHLRAFVRQQRDAPAGDPTAPPAAVPRPG